MAQDQQNNSDSKAAATSLDEVRKRLQSFGYLNSRIERFYLLSLSRTASQFFNRILLSLRVGFLAGTLAALLMTIGTLVFNVDLLKNKLDLVLLFIYFEVFFVILFSFLEFFLIILVGGLLRFIGGRRLVLAGQAISFLVGLAFFSYFFYWARSQAEYLRLFSVISMVAMFIILTLSCIFVAKCSWLGFLVAFRESDAGRLLPNWRRYGIETALSLAAVAMLVPFVMDRGKEAKESEVPVAILSTSDRWIVIGVDGLSREIIARFIQEGSLPTLQSFISDGQVALLRGESNVPPVTWTTIATGVPSIQHGIRAPEVRRWSGLTSWLQMTPLELAMHSVLLHAGFGQRQPVSGYVRKVKTFWEVLSDSGLRTGVVNWWGSWPARPIRGWNVSERYYYKLASSEKSQNETYPAELFQQYASSFRPGATKISGVDLDLFYSRLFEDRLKKDPVRIAALYLPGFDILNYEFFEARKIDPFSYTNHYAQHLQWLNGFLEQMKTQFPDYRLLLILHRGRSLPNDHSAIVISNAGPVSAKNAAYSELDIAPLLLYSCGAPISKTMSLDLIRAVIPPERLARMPVRFVPMYRQIPPAEPAHMDQFNDLLIEQMKSLGYLQ